ncbi:hypothetical protein M1523_02780 [Patescibacteria group bacterium]|nr:hypothetical protein [Patescibacteria group bacterium]MCL5091354.1 hypothetical protein [Patescibacteria group bacterium]
MANRGVEQQPQRMKSVDKIRKTLETLGYGLMPFGSMIGPVDNYISEADLPSQVFEAKDLAPYFLLEALRFALLTICVGGMTKVPGVAIGAYCLTGCLATHITDRQLSSHKNK